MAARKVCQSRSCRRLVQMIKVSFATSGDRSSRGTRSVRSKSVRQIRSANKVPNPGQCGLHCFILRGALRPNRSAHSSAASPASVTTGASSFISTKPSSISIRRSSSLTGVSWSRLPRMSRRVQRRPMAFSRSKSARGLFILMWKCMARRSVPQKTSPSGKPLTMLTPVRGKLCKDAAAEMW